MAEIQRYFDEFHRAIRLEDDDENAQLREKRELLLNDLTANLPDEIPAYRHFNQGSYAMHTGTMPLDGNYDIDVGIVFDCYSDRYADPLELKRAVKRALDRHNRTVRIRKPCVTVEYVEDGEVAYHVDLAIYVDRIDDVGLDLAVGRESCAKESRVWAQNDPEELIDKINTRFKEDEAAQMRRIIRYLKRWRDKCFPNGDGPISVALTVAAYRWFNPSIDMFTGKPNDLRALKALVADMLSRFTADLSDGGTLVNRLAINLPVTPYADLLADLTDVQATNFRDRLITLDSKLQQAIDEPAPELACQFLRSQLGAEFPVPEKSDTAKKVQAPYVHTGQSA